MSGNPSHPRNDYAEIIKIETSTVESRGHGGKPIYKPRISVLIKKGPHFTQAMALFDKARAERLLSKSEEKIFEDIKSVAISHS